MILLYVVSACGGSCWDGECVDGAQCFVSCGLFRRLEGPCGCGNQTSTGRFRHTARAAMYAGAWLAPFKLTTGVTWVGPSLEAASFLAFGAADAVLRTARPDGLFLHHVSAYEHSVVARWPEDEAMDRVRSVARREIADACDGIAWPGRRALGLVPYYGGLPDPDLTGNAHSRQPTDVKLAVLHANVCSLLRDFVDHVVVATCAETRDTADARAYFDALNAPWRRRLRVLPVKCRKPKTLPFKALSALQDSFPFSHAEQPRFIVYTEADQVLRWADDGTAAATFFVLRTFPNVVITPHRWHKRYGSDPSCGAACGMSITGQNRCHADNANSFVAVRNRTLL